MRVPTERWLELDEVDSTQSVAAAALEQEGDVPGVILAWHQLAGRGRFGREWLSQSGSSLAMSIILGSYAGHPKPWLIGMATAAAAASALRCRLQWPNDLVLDGKKLGGVLTELLPDTTGRKVPVVGVGANLGDIEFPEELQNRVTSLAAHRDLSLEPRRVALDIVERLRQMPEPDSWQVLQPIWQLFDETRGKLYRLPTGEEAIALGVGPEGELLCSVEGESRTVMAAEALFGVTQP